MYLRREPRSWGTVFRGTHVYRLRHRTVWHHGPVLYTWRGEVTGSVAAWQKRSFNLETLTHFKSSWRVSTCLFSLSCSGSERKKKGFDDTFALKLNVRSRKVVKKRTGRFYKVFWRRKSNLNSTRSCFSLGWFSCRGSCQFILLNHRSG